MEKLVLGTLTEHLQLAEYQPGFRGMNSTATPLHAIYDDIQRGLSENRPNKRTVMTALHLSRAFDTVNIEMKIILDTTLPPTINKWLGNYLSARQTYVTFRKISSKYRRVKQGVPQGGVLSPTLLNRNMRDCHFHL